jgi:hypothetical protein
VVRQKSIGWLGEYAVDRACMSGSGWRLMPYLPVFDTRHVDRVYAWDGVERPRFVQVKTAEGPPEDGVYRWRIPADRFVPYERFQVVLMGSDRESAEPVPVAWVLDSRELERVARSTRIPKTGKLEYHLWASVAGRDGLAPYRVRLGSLWRRLAPRDAESRPRLLVVPAADRFPTMHVEEGAYFEQLMITEVLRGAADRLIAYRPALDLEGRDMLVQLINAPSAAYFQIKGTASLENGVVRMDVPRETFLPRADFWLLVLAYVRAEGGPYPEFWLVSSREFARLTAESGAIRLPFYGHLDPAQDRWRQFRHPLPELASVLVELLSK